MVSVGSDSSAADGFPADASIHLIRAAKDGDTDAMDALIRRHLPGLRVFVRAHSNRMLRARESSSDLVQSTCREVLQSVDRYEWQGEGSFRYWLYTVAMNKIRKRTEYHGAAKRNPGREVDAPRTRAGVDADLVDIYQTMCSPSQHAIAGEFIERFEETMEAMPENYREIILLSRVVGLENKDIAAKLDKTEGAARALLSRALSCLVSTMDRTE